MTAVKRGKLVIGAIERTNDGNWFADRIDADGNVSSIGAFRSRSAAVAAVEAVHDGEYPVGQIRPQFRVGPPARGMS